MIPCILAAAVDLDLVTELSIPETQLPYYQMYLVYVSVEAVPCTLEFGDLNRAVELKTHQTGYHRCSSIAFFEICKFSIGVVCYDPEGSFGR